MTRQVSREVAFLSQSPHLGYYISKRGHGGPDWVVLSTVAFARRMRRRHMRPPPFVNTRTRQMKKRKCLFAFLNSFFFFSIRLRGRVHSARLDIATFLRRRLRLLSRSAMLPSSGWLFRLFLLCRSPSPLCFVFFTEGQTKTRTQREREGDKVGSVPEDECSRRTKERINIEKIPTRILDKTKWGGERGVEMDGQGGGRKRKV